jgi:protein-S-isoprenylcysteine O-methyltransferase Ste14
VATVSVRARLDFGRIIMVPAAAAMLVLDVQALTHGSRGAGGAAALRWAGAALVCAFYVLMIWCYLRRGRAVATSGSVTGYAAAVTATLLPFTLPLLHGASPGAGQYAGYLLVVAGAAWAVWSVRFLGRSISVIAQAREVVDRGPYRLVRHPLYVGELVSALGVAVVAGTRWALCVWVALCALQAYRALREEQVLLQALPGYRSYQARTAALLPGVF